MDGRWRGVGDDDGDDLLQFLVQQGARTEFLNPEKGFAMAAALQTSFWKTIKPLGFLGQGLYVVERGVRGGARGGLTTPRRGLGPTRAWAW